MEYSRSGAAAFGDANNTGLFGALGLEAVTCKNTDQQYALLRSIEYMYI
jgi:hypothetical protein